jgi:hypothetical protein
MGCANSRSQAPLEEPTFNVKASPEKSALKQTTTRTPDNGAEPTPPPTASIREVSWTTETYYPERIPGKAAFMVPVPSGFRPGDQFMMEVPDGRKVPVTVPLGVKPGQMFEAYMPNRRVSKTHSPSKGILANASSKSPDASAATAPAADDAAAAPAPVEAAPAETAAAPAASEGAAAPDVATTDVVPPYAGAPAVDGGGDAEERL